MGWIKKWIVLVGVVGLAIAVVGGGCGWAATRVARQILNAQLSIINSDYKVFRWCTNGLPFVDRLEQMLGGKYVILLQNNMELRPSGGFMGSYAIIETDNKGIKQIKVQDIYEPDGKLAGHVEPPYPVQEAFGQGWWKLRDANWDVDFASAAGAVRWFFEQGGERGVEGIIAVNLGLVNSLIGVFGPIKLATYDEVVTDNNFYQLAQTYAETRRAGDKTDKRGFLGAVGVVLEERIKSFEVVKWIKLSKLALSELRRGEILIWMKDLVIQKEIEFRKWGGKLEANWDQNSDYLYIVESNLGANKANCCIDRHVSVNVSGNKSDVELTWINNNEFEHPRPPVFWGGNYIDYVRVIIPKNAVIVKATVGGKELRRAGQKDFAGPNALRQGRSEGMYVVEERGGLQMIGFWTVVEAQKEVRAEVETENPGKPEKLLVKHQPGSGVTNYQIVVDGVIRVTGRLDRDKVFVLQSEL